MARIEAALATQQPDADLIPGMPMLQIRSAALGHPGLTKIGGQLDDKIDSVTHAVARNALPAQ